MGLKLRSKIAVRFDFIVNFYCGVGHDPDNTVRAFINVLIAQSITPK